MNRKTSAIISGIVALVGMLFTEMYLEWYYFYESGNQIGIYWNTITFPIAIRMLILAVIFAIGLYIFFMFFDEISTFLFKYRFLISAIILIMLVFFKVSGSSIAEWVRWIGGEETGKIFGISRMSRGDEFAVFTPFTLSQAYNHHGIYPYYNETIRGTMTDTGVIYALPSWNIITLFRPFLLGYLFLGVERGLSFFWVARYIVLFLITFEFARIWTKDDKKLSCLVSIMITFSSAIQWWFAINSIAEIFIFGQGAVLCFYHYLKTNNYKRRAILGGLITYCGLAYIFTFYPAWQISVAYVFLAFVIWCIWEKWKDIKFEWKKDGLIIGSAIVTIIFVLLYFWHLSGETIISSAETVYPGNRINTGGGLFSQVFRYGASLFLPIKCENLYPFSAEPEMAQIFTLFPLGIFLSLYVLIKEKRKDKLLIVLSIIEIFLIAYCAIPFPEFLSKITLLSRCTPHRVILALGYLNIIQIVRVIVINSNIFSRKIASSIAIIFASMLTVLNSILCKAYMTTIFNIILWTVLVISVYFIIRSRDKICKKILVVSMSFFIALTGIMVNPVQAGCDVIYKNALVKEIYEISKDDDGLWLVEGKFPLTNIPITVGAPTINSTNVYPDLERWKLLDKDEEFSDVYNRYAHINVELTDDKTEFVKENAADTFLLRLNFEDLKTLNVKYLLSQNDYTNKEETKIEKVSQVGRFYIYQVIP